MSDGSDEEKSSMALAELLPRRSESPLKITQSLPRPQTARSPSMIPDKEPERPSSAPPTTIVLPRQHEKYGGVTWSEIKMPPVNVGIEEVKYSHFTFLIRFFKCHNF